MNKKLTQKKLKKILKYNSETGVFTWLVSKSGIKRKLAGSIDREGYRRIGIEGKNYSASRLVWLYMEGYFPEYQIDHINRIKNDDRWENLRHV